MEQNMVAWIKSLDKHLEWHPDVVVHSLFELEGRVNSTQRKIISNRERRKKIITKLLDN